MEKLDLIKKLSWNEVFEFWRSNEAHQKDWKRLAKERGYDSWEDWRKSYADRFRCPELDWSLWEIANPAKTVSQFWGGPFSGWVKNHYGGEKTKIFAELAQSEYLRENPKVKEMLASFPDSTVMTGIQIGNRVYIIEGMHRGVALAIMDQEKKEFSGRVLLALSQSDEELKYEPRINKSDLEDN